MSDPQTAPGSNPPDPPTEDLGGGHDADPRLRLGAVYHGYRIEAELGRGGQGVVYKAWDTGAERVVALKALASEGQNGVAPLLDEARKAARLSHENIVRVLYVTPGATTPFFVAMEFVDGITLAELIRLEAPLPERVALRIVAQIASALAHAHGEGLVHLDVKPANVLIARKSGRAMVTDFGMAVHHSERWSRTSGGTALYMAPEQLARRTEQFDGRTDMWGLGVVLFEMLTGRRPFGAEGAVTREQLTQEIMTVDPKPPSQWRPDLSADSDEVCLRCLRKEIADRFGSMSRLAERIAELPTVGGEEPDGPTGLPPSKSSRGVAIVTGGCLLAVAVAILSVAVAIGVVEGDEVRRFLTRVLPRLLR